MFDSGYYKPNKWGMIICGSWPGSSKFEAWTMKTILIGLIISVLIPEYRYLYKSWGNYDAIIACIPTQLARMMILCKVIFLVGNQKMIQSAVNQMTNDWNFLTEKSSEQVMHIHGVIVHRRIVLYFYFYAMAEIFFFGCSLFPVMLDIVKPLNESREKTEPLETDYGVTFEDHFYTIILHGVLTEIVSCCYLWTADTFIMIMVQHCCGLFETTGFILKKLNSNDEKKNSEKYEINVILFAIAIHRRAIAFAEFIEGSVTKLYAFIVMNNMIGISFTGVNTILKLDKPNEAMSMGVFTMVMMVHLFFNTLPGQQLIDESSRLSNSIYDCDWTSLTIKSRKFILLMLVRSFKPSVLTAGKIYQLNMENFGQVMKTAMSFLAVIQSFD